MSMFKDFALLFLSMRRVLNFGFIPRLATYLTIIIISLVLFIVKMSFKALIISVASTLAVEFLILWFSGGLKKVLSGLTVIFVFVLIGFSVTLISMFLGFAPPPLDYAIVSMFRVVALVLAFSTAFQLLTIEEVRWVMFKLGLREISTVIALTLSLLPLTLMQFSEAIVTVKLKYGGKKLFKVVKPLIIYSVMNSLNIAEALYIHGVYPPRRPRMFNGVKDLVFLFLSTALIIAFLTCYRLC